MSATVAAQRFAYHPALQRPWLAGARPALRDGRRRSPGLGADRWPTRQRPTRPRSRGASGVAAASAHEHDRRKEHHVMTARFTGKVALITGGGTGIGRSIARAFAREGARVVVAGRRTEPLDETVGLIVGKGGDAIAVAADVTRSADVAELISCTVGHFGGLDVAINNV